MFVSEDQGHGGTLGVGARNPLKELHELILANHNRRCSDPQLVSMVSEFYETEVRPWTQTGPWSRRQIWEHIYLHMNDPSVQSAGVAAALFAQIQSLRSVCWTLNTETGLCTPNAANIKLLADLAVKHQALAEARRKRAAETGV
jgi:hypothetical protein